MRGPRLRTAERARTEGLKSALPPGTRLLDINITPEGTCIVDFSSHIEVSGSKAEALAVFSIVNTLSQFPTVIMCLYGGREKVIRGAISALRSR